MGAKSMPCEKHSHHSQEMSMTNLNPIEETKSELTGHSGGKLKRVAIGIVPMGIVSIGIVQWE